MSTIAISVTPPGGSPSDITDDVVFTETTFSQSMNAVAGQCRIAVRDPERTLSFVTGTEVTLEIDGVLLWGGYITVVLVNRPANVALVMPVIVPATTRSDGNV